MLFIKFSTWIAGKLPNGREISSTRRGFHRSESAGRGILDKINPFKGGDGSSSGAKACPPVKKCDDVVSVAGVQIPMYGFGTWQVRICLEIHA